MSEEFFSVQYFKEIVPFVQLENRFPDLELNEYLKLEGMLHAVVNEEFVGCELEGKRFMTEEISPTQSLNA